MKSCLLFLLYIFCIHRGAVFLIWYELVLNVVFISTASVIVAVFKIFDQIQQTFIGVRCKSNILKNGEG